MIDNKYVIYHIPGKKIGVTNDLYNRVECQQGYEVGEYEVLESSDDIDYISKREIELQKKYGYKVDLVPYNELSVNLKLKNMKINVTEQTTTFPCPVNKLKGQLMDNLEMRWDTEHGSVYLDTDLIKWIVKSAKTSMFNTERCYVYNKAMIDDKYVIYHIPGKKIGVTNDLYNRVECQQGYEVGEYEVLESSDDIDYISKREIELQKKYGYRVDLKPYNELSVNQKLKNMKINITEQTTTFPCPLNKLKGQLMDNLEMRWETEHGLIDLDVDLVKWIVKSAKTSMFNDERCYVYNKAMARYLDNRKDQLPFPEQNGTWKAELATDDEVVFYFDMIREWAEDRGIYANGDPKTQYIKLMEEAGEVGRAILKEDLPEIKDGIGDMVVVLTNLAELCGLTIEECVESAYDVISKRTGKMKNGTFVKD